MELKELDGQHRACKYCGGFFITKVWNKWFCDYQCCYKNRKRKLRQKSQLQKILSTFGLGVRKNKVMQPNQKPKKNDSNKIDYARLTFILSVLGFIGSIGFYLGVLRDVYSPANDKQKIELLRVENQELQNTISVLVEELAEDE